MSDPFANLKTLDNADLTASSEWCADLQMPFDDEPDFDELENPEIHPHKRIGGDAALIRRPTRRLFVDYRANPDAFRHLKRLPKDGESLHGIISGKYALFDLIPALLERTGETIADLIIATLGFSKQNGADLCQMLDDRQVKRAALVCSHYFAKTSKPIYDIVIPELLKRRQRVVAMRSHCKLLVIRMSGGGRYVVESSANLRSCVNVEQFVMTRCPKLYAFHRRWLEREILADSRKAAT